MRTKGRRELHGQMGKGECQPYIIELHNKWNDNRVRERGRDKMRSRGRHFFRKIC